MVKINAAFSRTVDGKTEYETVHRMKFDDLNWEDINPEKIRRHMDAKPQWERWTLEGYAKVQEEEK